MLSLAVFSVCLAMGLASVVPYTHGTHGPHGVRGPHGVHGPHGTHGVRGTHGGFGPHGTHGGHPRGGYANLYHGRYNGKCSADGFYYNDVYSFVQCSNGNAYVQKCAPGTRNSGYKKYNAGHAYHSVDFCDVNLVDHGYALKHHGHHYGGHPHGGYGTHGAHHPGAVHAGYGTHGVHGAHHPHGGYGTHGAPQAGVHGGYGTHGAAHSHGHKATSYTHTASYGAGTHGAPHTHGALHPHGAHPHGAHHPHGAGYNAHNVAHAATAHKAHVTTVHKHVSRTH